MFQRVKGNRTNPCIDNLSFLLTRHHEPPSSSAKLFLPIIPIGIVTYALTLLLDNLSRNSCIHSEAKGISEISILQMNYNEIIRSHIFNYI